MKIKRKFSVGKFSSAKMCRTHEKKSVRERKSVQFSRRIFNDPKYLLIYITLSHIHTCKQSVSDVCNLSYESLICFHWNRRRLRCLAKLSLIENEFSGIKHIFWGIFTFLLDNLNNRLA